VGVLLSAAHGIDAEGLTVVFNGAGVGTGVEKTRRDACKTG
jgi:hypothetical protein